MDTNDWHERSGGGNDFFSPRLSQERPEGRFYAALEIDEIDENVGNPEWSRLPEEPVYLECAGADWVDQVHYKESSQFWRGIPLSVIALGTSEWRSFIPADAEPGTIAWFEIEVSSAALNEGNARQFNQLLDPGIDVYVRFTSFKGLGSNASPLDTRHWIKQDPTSPSLENVIPAIEANALATAGVAVFDVGQGACQALMAMCEEHLRPVLYIDVGGGVMQNLSTFPKQFNGFGFDAPIILSHWDWDHWSSVSRFPQLLKSDWIAPLPPEKPIQQALAWILQGLSRLTLWTPGMLPTYGAESFKLERCTGKTTNDSGIAVILFGGAAGEKSCLLPGDAGYSYIPSVKPGNTRFSLLSISHHGGRLHSATIPLPERDAVAACSVGSGNSYKHPFWETVQAHCVSGWPIPVSTGHFGRRPSHVFLPWDGQLQVVPPCPHCGDSTLLYPEYWNTR